MTELDYLIICQYIVLVISPSIFLGRLVYWYFWQEQIIENESIFSEFKVYLIAILLIVIVKLSMIFNFLPNQSILIKPHYFWFIGSFFIPIFIIGLIINNKSKILIKESFTLKFDTSFLKILIFIMILPFLIFLFILGTFLSKDFDIMGVIIFSPFFFFLLGIDVLEVTYQIFKYLKKSIKVQNKIKIYEKEFINRHQSFYTNNTLLESSKYKCISDILLDTHGWKTIFFDEEKIFHITWEIENGLYVGPFIKVHENTLNTFSDRNWDNELLPCTRLDEVLKKNRKITFDTSLLLKKDNSFKYLSLDNSYKEFFFNNMNKSFTIISASNTVPGYQADLGFKYLGNSRTFQIKDDNGTLFTLNFDFLQIKGFVYLEV